MNAQLVELSEPEELEPEDVPSDSESELLLSLLLLPLLLLVLLKHLDTEEICFSFPAFDGGRDPWAATSAESSILRRPVMYTQKRLDEIVKRKW